MNKWNNRQAEATIEKCLKEMFQQLKQFAFEAKQNGMEISEHQFKEEMDVIERQTQEKISNRFAIFKSDEQIYQQAKNEFKDICARANKPEESKQDDRKQQQQTYNILRANAACTNTKDFQPTALEQDFIEEQKGDQP